MLGLVGFLATALYWPGASGAATTPRWVTLLLIVPWLVREQRITLAHAVGAVLLGYAALSLAWTSALLDAINQVFILLLWAALFCFGAQTADLRRFYLGCACGIGLSSAVAVAQLLGWHPLPELPGNGPAGLFVNGNYLAEAAALVAIALISERLWWWLIPVAPALLLVRSGRGALLAVAVAMVAWLWGRSRLASALLVGVIAGSGIILMLHASGDPSSTERLLIWRSTWAGVTWFGHGLGSFFSGYPVFDLRVNQYAYPEYAHNEFLHAAFELGVPGVLLMVGFWAAVMAGPLNTARVVVIGLLTEMCFAYPLHLPSTAAVGFLAAGAAVRDRALLRDLFERRRMAVQGWLAWRRLLRSIDDLPGRRGEGLSLRPPIPRRAVGAHDD